MKRLNRGGGSGEHQEEAGKPEEDDEKNLVTQSMRFHFMGRE